MRWLIVLTAGIVGLGLGGCQEGAMYRMASPSDPQPMYDIAHDPTTMQPRETRPNSSTSPTGTPPADGSSPASLDIRAADLAQQRVVVYTAEYAVAVANTDPAMNEVEKLAEEFGGYLQTRGVDKIIIRVPAAKFKAATERIDRLGQLVSRAVQAQDITEQYTDLKSRLTASQAMLKQLQGLLEKAADTRVALEIQTEIGKTMTEIERLTGQIRLLENRVALSTITVWFRRWAEAPRSALLARKLPFNWLHTLGIGKLLDY